MIILLLFPLVNSYINKYFVTSPALDNQCTDIYTADQNSFLGGNYFYDYLSQGGTYTDLSQITFMMWVKIISTNPKGKGKQILFQFVDGPDSTAYLNIQLFLSESQGLKLGLQVNSLNVNPIIMLKLGSLNSVSQLSGWNHILLSIDQSTSDALVNLKFFDGVGYNYFSIQQPFLMQQIVQYKFSQLSRITNEILQDQATDIRLCGYIANFQYYIGWVSMDSEPYVDYQNQLVFYVKPQKNMANIAPGQSQTPIKTYNGIQYPGNFGLNVYKDSRIEYLFNSDIQSYVFTFWMNSVIQDKGNKNPYYQMFSFCNDAMLETSIGLGLSNNNELVLFQSYSQKVLAPLSSGFNHIIAQFTHTSFDNDFNPTNELKYLTIYINGVRNSTIKVNNVKKFSRIVIGFLFRNQRDRNYVQLQEMKIFSGSGVRKSRNGCILEIAGDYPYCIYCDSSIWGNSYCLENQQPYTNQYQICRGGYYYQNNDCILIPGDNCLRYASYCTQCQYGYKLVGVKCVLQSYYSQICTGNSTKCQIGVQNGVVNLVPSLCIQGYGFSSSGCQQNKGIPAGCQITMNMGCYLCQNNYKLQKSSNGKYTCVTSCSIPDSQRKTTSYYFDDTNCQQYCTQYTTYSYDCNYKGMIGTCTSQCPSGSQTYTTPGICVTDLQNLQDNGNQQTTSCGFGFNNVILSVVQRNCVYPCGQCFGFTQIQCLSCQNPSQYYDQAVTSCYDQCLITNVLQFSNTLNMMCVYQCPSNTFIYNYFCLNACPANTYILGQQCLDAIPPGMFENNGILNNCPQTCLTCTSTACTSCVGNYPTDGNLCVTSCLPKFLDFDSNICVDQCQPTDYVFQTNNLNGFAFKVCYRNKCGYVQANTRIFTVQHETNQFQCMQPCDDGYYADYGVYQCKPCTNNCQTCSNKSSYCLSCKPNFFFSKNICLTSCQRSYQDYINWKCAGGCDNGFTINENNIQACVSQCGDYYPNQKYQYQQYCLSAPPKTGGYCIQYQCGNCDSSCLSCNGPYQYNCTACSSGTYLLNGYCGTGCGWSYFDTTTNNCASQCPSKSYYYGSYCYSPCPSGKYQYDIYCYDSKPYGVACKQLSNGSYSCAACYKTCETCTSTLSTNCTYCRGGYYLLNGQCVSRCPSGYRYDGWGRKCSGSCPVGYILQGQSCVAQCSVGWVYYNGNCNQTCPSGTYAIKSYDGQGNLTGLQCNSCANGCNTCTGGNTNQCLSCQTGNYLTSSTCSSSCSTNIYNMINNTCVSSCPSTGYIDEVSASRTNCVSKCDTYYYGRLCLIQCISKTWANGYICTLCSSLCSSCFGSQIDQCNTCEPGIYLDQTTCVKQCPAIRPLADQTDYKCKDACPQFTFCKNECVQQCYSGSYIVGQNCIACAQECIQCYSNTSSDCVTCANGYYLNGTTCQSTCPSFINQISQTCVAQCPPNLFQNGNLCQTACPSNLVSNQMVCSPSCPSNTYLSTGICMNCHSNCLTCFGGTSTQCYTCTAGIFLSGNSCLITCPIFHNMVLMNCETTCPANLFTVQDLKECLSTCPANYITQADNNTCQTKCLDGYYQNINNCIKCDSSCTLCTSNTICSQCSQGYVLEINQCRILCSSSNLFNDYTNRMCQSICPQNLLHYQSYGKGFCLESCPDQTYLFGQFCYDQCPTQMYPDLQNTCQACPISCTTCTSYSVCTGCQSGYLFTKGICGNDCGNQLLDVQTSKCVDTCPNGKYELLGKCLVICPSDPFYFIYLGKCIIQCPANTYRDGQVCTTCAPECLTCVGPTENDCEVCSPTYYQNDQICTHSCPVNLLTDKVNMMCTLTCNNGTFQDGQFCVDQCSVLRYQQTCVNSCPQSTYIDGIFCIDCDFKCFQCNISGCQKCNAPYYLNNGYCGTVCPQLYDTINNQCIDKCLTNQVLYIDNCMSSCPALNYLYQGVCLRNCPNLTTIYNGQCVECQERCINCTSNTQCTQCSSGYFLCNGVCLVQCPLVKPLNDMINWQCQTVCPGGTYQVDNFCMSSCSLNIYGNQCLQKCPDGYFGQTCTQCRSECKTCLTYNQCTSCNPNFYLDGQQCDTNCPLIINTLNWECTTTCSAFLYEGIKCLSACPVGTVQQDKICTNQCKSGYYDNNSICTQCPSQCKECSSPSNCSSCSMTYFLNGQQCLSVCPIGLLGDPKSQQCVSNCTNMLQFNGLCVYGCPKKYYQSGSFCVEVCPNNQVLSDNLCVDCPLECDGCKGLSNYECKACKNQINGVCELNTCPSGYVKVETMCKQCEFKCAECSSLDLCTTCRGDRRGSECQCAVGYFDDGVSDSCQLCPCPSCSSATSCNVCKNNLITPNCSCNRKLNEDWCITCDVGRTTITFTNELDYIIVDFNYYISINIINPFMQQDCNLFFDNSNILGNGSLCNLSWNRTQVVIQLGIQANITIGDQLVFKQNTYKDINDQPCSGFISQFINTTIQSPQMLLKPYVQFDVPKFVSSCRKFTIKQIPIKATGQRDLRILSWELQQLADQDLFFKIDEYLSDQHNSLTFDVNVLSPNVTYTIIARYINMVGRINSTVIQFTTVSASQPYIYLTSNPLAANIYIYDCLAYKDLTDSFTLTMLIQDLLNNTLQFYQLGILDQYKIFANESALPKNLSLLVTISAGEQTIRQYVRLDPLPYQLKFSQTNRFLGLQGQINARAIDPNINDSILQQFGFKYQWICTNLFNLQQCKSFTNQVLQFPDTRVLQISVDISNYTYVFYCKASKGNQQVIQYQSIVITDLNLESTYSENLGAPTGVINPNDDVFILLKSIQTYAMIMYNSQLIGTVKISGLSLEFKLANYLQSFDDSTVTIYLLPSNDSMKFQINKFEIIGDITINPNTGYALDLYNISMKFNQSLDCFYQFFFYNNYTNLQNDVQKLNINGLPLNKASNNPSILVPLQSGIGNYPVYILCQVMDQNGAIKYFNTSIYIQRRDYSLKDLFISVDSIQQNATSIQEINVGLEILKSEQQQTCLKQCSGVGSCIDRVCQCPPGYYFQDCSGTKQEYQQYLDSLQNITDKLLLQDFTDNQHFKLFFSSLQFLMTYPITFQNFDDNKVQSYLIGFQQNIQNRINSLNQLQINLQFQETDAFQYDSLDIDSIVQLKDIQQAMMTTDLVWYNLMQNGTYLNSYNLRQLIDLVIQLTLSVLPPESSMNYSTASSKILVNRTANFAKVNQRLLYTTQYDIIQAEYIFNFYKDDGYFPYPESKYKLYDYSISNMNRKQNINYKINYTFQLIPTTLLKNYVCVTRNKQHEWTAYDCETNIIKSTVQCNCTRLAPTTLVNDYSYKVQGAKEKEFKLENIIGYILAIQTFLWFLLLVKGNMMDNDSQEDDEGGQIKYGYVKTINKLPRSSKHIIWKSWINNKQVEHNQTLDNMDIPEEYTKQNDQYESQASIQMDYKVKKENKYDVSFFMHHHSILNIIYKYKKFLPRWFRACLLLMRVTACISLGGVYAYQDIPYQLATLAVLGSFLFMRVIENLITQQFKKVSYVDSLVMKFLFLGVIGIIIIASLLGFWIQYIFIQNQTSWILSYLIALTVDLVAIDFIVLIANKYLGEDAKRNLKKQVKKIKKIYMMQKKNSE
ncbi:hypothetical protein pb186bvf_007406 [Paramecium bursaria]